jgi:hypothetical protein
MMDEIGRGRSLGLGRRRMRMVCWHVHCTTTLHCVFKVHKTPRLAILTLAISTVMKKGRRQGRRAVGRLLGGWLAHFGSESHLLQLGTASCLVVNSLHGLERRGFRLDLCSRIAGVIFTSVFFWGFCYVLFLV